MRQTYHSGLVQELLGAAVMGYSARMLRVAKLTLSAVVAGSLGCAACWSWTIGSGTVEGGSDATDSKVSEMDAGSDGASPMDARVTDSGTVSIVDSAPIDSGPSCATRLSTLQNELTVATECSGTCTATVMTQCNCLIFVGSASSAATTDYENDLAAYKDAGCKAGCGNCGVPPAFATCLSGAVPAPDGSVMITAVCTPPPQ